MYTGLTKDICAQAWDIVLPAIKAAHDAGVINGYTGTVVVVDPASADGDILFTGIVGDEENADTMTFAPAKTKVALRTGMPSWLVGEAHPHLYQPGDIKYPGAIISHGLVVAFSGVEGYHDEMIAEWMASAIRGICRELMHGEGGPMRAADPFLNG